MYILCISWGLWYNCCEWFTLRLVISKRTGMPPWCVARLQLNRICRNRTSVSVMIILFYCCPFTNTIFNDLSRGKNTLSNEIQHLMHQMTHTHGRVCVNVSTPLPCKIKIIANKHKIRKKIMQPAHNIEHFVVCLLNFQN